MAEYLHYSTNVKQKYYEQEKTAKDKKSRQ